MCPLPEDESVVAPFMSLGRDWAAFLTNEGERIIIIKKKRWIIEVTLEVDVCNKVHLEKPTANFLQSVLLALKQGTHFFFFFLQANIEDS